MVSRIRQKLMNEIAVCTMQLERIEPGLIGAPRRVAPRLHEGLYLVALERPRHRPSFTARNCPPPHPLPRLPIVDLGSPVQWGCAFPWPLGSRLATAMTKLN